MKKKLSLFMATVLLLATPTNIAYDNSNSVLVKAAEEDDADVLLEEQIIIDDEGEAESISQSETEFLLDDERSISDASDGMDDIQDDSEGFLLNVEEVSEVPDSAAAIIYSVEDSGNLGDNVSWYYDGKGTITASGEGATWDLKSAEYLLTSSARNIAQSIIIKDGITRIGNYLFWNFEASWITIPKSVTSIGTYAINDYYVTDIYYAGTEEDWAAIDIDDYNYISNITVHYNSSTPTGYVASGICGLYVVWMLDDNGTLNISGRSKISNRWDVFDDIWPDYVSVVTSISIEDGITGISGGAFSCFTKVKKVYIASSVAEINDSAFSGCSSLTDVYYAGSETEWNSISIDSNNEYLTNAVIHYNSSGLDSSSNDSDSGYFGWSFINTYDGFGYSNPYSISEERYAEVFGNAYVAVAKAAGQQTYSSMIEEWGGNCYGMCVTAILFDLGMLDFSSYSSATTLNTYSTKIMQNGSCFYAMSSQGSEITNLIERYQILQNGSYEGYKYINSSQSWLEGSYYYEESSGSYSHIHISGGDYISKVLNWIINSDEPLILDMYDQDFAHAVVVRTDKEPEEQENGWWKVYIYDPNHPYMDQSIIEEYTDELFSLGIASNYANTRSEDTYIELNPILNLWRYCGSNNGSDPDAYYGTTLDGNLSYYYYIDDNSNIDYIGPSYIIVYSISNVNYPISFNGSEPWMEEWDDAIKKATGLSYTENSNLTIYSPDGEEIIVSIQEGIPLIYDDDVDNSLIAADGSSGGRLTIPYTDFIVEYESGDDISIFGSESVINVACNGSVSLEFSMEEDQVVATGNGISQITVSVSDVYSNNDYTSIDIFGTLDDEDSISVKLTDDELIIDGEIDGNTSLSVYTDNDSDPSSQELGEISEKNEDIYEYDVTSEGELVLDSDGIYRYYVNGVFDSTYNGLASYNGGLFFITNGLINTSVNGLCQSGSAWYYASGGQVQTGYTGLALYDGAWFYITNGVLDTSKKGLVPYDTGVFLVADGQLLLSYNGLWQYASSIGGDNQWYFIAAGMVQDVSQVVMYDGAFFVVENGILDSDYNGTITYDGAKFKVVNGQLYG